MSWINSNEPERRLRNESRHHNRLASSRILWVVLAVVLAAGAVWMWRQAGRGPRVVHASTCDATALSGSYGYTITGFTIDNAGNLGFFSSAGSMVADGQGNLTGQETDVFDGQVTRGAAITGSYTVNPDCSGSFTTNSPTAGGPFLYDFAITDSGNGMQIVEADAGTNITGTARKL